MASRWNVSYRVQLLSQGCIVTLHRGGLTEAKLVKGVCDLLALVNGVEEGSLELISRVEEQGVLVSGTGLVNDCLDTSVASNTSYS
jgi:hypothetical protein